MYEKIPIAVVNKEPPRIFKKVLDSFILMNKRDTQKFPLTIGINNQDRDAVITKILGSISCVKDILYRNNTENFIPFNTLILKMLSYKPKAVIYIPTGFVCIKPLILYADSILKLLKEDDTIGGIYIGRDKIKNSKFSGNKINYEDAKNSSFYKTSMAFQFVPFVLPQRVAEEMLSMEGDEKKLNKWYANERYQTLGIEGGCFQKY